MARYNDPQRYNCQPVISQLAVRQSPCDSDQQHVNGSLQDAGKNMNLCDSNRTATSQDLVSVKHNRVNRLSFLSFSSFLLSFPNPPFSSLPFPALLSPSRLPCHPFPSLEYS